MPPATGQPRGTAPQCEASTMSDEPAFLPHPILTDILPALKPVVRGVADRGVESWIRTHENRFAEVVDLISGLLEWVEGYAPGDAPADAFWARLDDFYREVDQWVDRHRYVAGDAGRETVLPDWEAAIDAALADLPETVEIMVREVPASGWAAMVGLRTARHRKPVPARDYLWARPLGRFENVLAHLWVSHLRFAARRSATLIDQVRDLFSDLLGDPEAPDPLSILSDASRRARWRERAAARLEAFHVASEWEAYRQWMEAEFEERWSQLHVLERHDISQVDRSEALEASHLAAASGERVEAVKATIADCAEQWHNFLAVEQQDWHYDVALIRLQIKALKTLSATLAEIRTVALETVHPVFEEVLEPVREAAAVFDTNKKETSAELRRRIQHEKRRFMPLLRDRKMPLVMDALVAGRLEERLGEFREALETDTRRIRATYRIFRRRNVEDTDPIFDVVEVPVAELLHDAFDREFVKGFQAVRRDAKARLQKVLNGLSEVDQVAEFNFDAAIEILAEEKDVERARESLADGLQRAVNGLLEQQRRIAAFPVEVQGDLIPLTTRYLVEVQELSDNEKAISLKLQLARARTRERVLEYRRRFWVRLRRSVPLAYRAVRDALRGVLERLRSMLQFTGLVAPPPGDRQSLFQLLATTDARRKELPYIYQRLFRVAPLHDERFFTGREADLAAIGTAFANWQDGHEGITALVGERGSGRTTLLNFAEQRFFADLPVVRIDLAERGSDPGFLRKALKSAFPDLKSRTPENMIAELETAEEPLVCILENLQYFYLRTVRGFEAVETLMELFAKTGRRIFWVVTCTRYAWNYLDKVLGLGRSFTTVLELGQISPEAIEAIILKRHRVTGFELEFEAPPHIAESRRFRKLAGPAEQQAFLQAHFFDQLEKFGSGNITVTQLYWLNAIRRFDDDRIVLNPEVNLDSAFLYELPPEELFALGAILQHEALGVAELARVMRIGERRADLILTTLANRGILLEGGPGFMIHPFLYRPMVTVLKVKNIIH